MFYHASSIENIKILEPRISNHNIPLIYFSTKRENVLVYLSNAIEKFCKEKNFSYTGVWQKWGSYGYKDKILVLEEYYPNATEETYKGVSGFIYNCENIEDEKSLDIKIPFAHITSKPVSVSGIEFIKDAYEELLLAEKNKKIKIIRYEEFIKERKNWLSNIIKEEYKNAENHKEYKFFLENKFPDFIKE